MISRDLPALPQIGSQIFVQTDSIDLPLFNSASDWLPNLSSTVNSGLSVTTVAHSASTLRAFRLFPINNVNPPLVSRAVGSQICDPEVVTADFCVIATTNFMVDTTSKLSASFPDSWLPNL